MINFSGIEGALSPIRFFEEISKIPHGSGSEGALCDYIEDFANRHGLFCLRDEYDNIIIKKPASPGRSGRPTVILQGHSDMVLARSPECEKDLEKEGLSIYRDGDFLRAHGTSLGADDGIALAYALAILDSDSIPHPPLEVLFTSGEEIGMSGAMGLDSSKLSGRLLINIDSDEEGVFTVGCAGGARLDISLPVEREPLNGFSYSLSVSGLIGGHSGIDIDKNRVNAIKLTAKMLSEIKGARLVSLSGGTADNAIPNDAKAVFATGFPISDKAQENIKNLFSEMTVGESEAVYSLCEAPKCENAISEKATAAALSLLSEIPSGVVDMSRDIPGLVETSLNIGTVSLTEDALLLGVSLRSSKGDEKERLAKSITDIAKRHGAKAERHGDYPEWEYRRDSYLRDKMSEVFLEAYGYLPKIITVHAGLECGILSRKIAELDCVSIGPDNFNLHTPDEHLSLSSTARVFEYLKLLLEKI